MMFRKWKRKRIYQRVFQLRDLAKDNVELAIRLSDPDAGQEGFDKYHDTIIYTVIDNITNYEWLDKTLSESWKRYPLRDSSGDLVPLLSEYVSNQGEVEQLVNKVRLNLQVKKWLIMYLRIQCYILNFMTAPDIVVDEREIRYWTKRLENLDGKAEAIIIGDIENLLSDAKRDMKSFRFSLSIRKTVKIPLSFKKAGSIISVFPLLFLISGFIYTYLLYNFFGVPISLYFSVSDYISSSIERIYIVLVTTAISTVLLFPVLRKASREYVVNVESKLKRPDYIRVFIWKWIKSNYFRGFIWLFFLGSVYTAFTEDGRMFHFMISLIICSGGILIIPALSERFFDNRVHAAFLLLVMLTLMSCTYSVVYWQVYDILAGEESVPKLCEQVNVIFDNKIKIPCGSPVIGATESHIFIFDQDDATTVIFPRSSMKQDVFNLPLFENSKVNQFFRLLNEESEEETHDEQGEVR